MGFRPDQLRAESSLGATDGTPAETGAAHALGL
jgi:hypothetical protein